MTRFDFGIGTSAPSIINVEQLPTPLLVGVWDFKSAQDFRLRGDMSVQSFGPPSVTWTQSIITTAQRDQWRVFCPGPSAPVYIRTRVHEDRNYHVFPATMIWPEEEANQAGRILNFTLKFYLGEEVE